MYDKSKSKGKNGVKDAEEYLISFFAEIPELQIKKGETHSRKWTQPDIEFRLCRGDQKSTLLIEVKASAEPRFVADWLDHLPESREWPEVHYPVLCAPYISPKAAEMLKSRGVGYIDLSGNCWLNLEFLFLERSGRPNRFKIPKEQLYLFAARSSRIVRALLENPTKEWTLQELAQTTGVSLGLVHRVSKALEERLFAEKRRGRFTLQDPGGLLDAWRSFSIGLRVQWQRYYWPGAQDIRAGMHEITRIAREAELRHAFTGPAAASLLVPYLMVSAIHCYVDTLRSDLLDALKVDPLPSGGNLWFNVIQREEIFLGSQQIEGLYVVSNIQIYLDLCALGGRGEEAAEALRERKLGF